MKKATIFFTRNPTINVSECMILPRAQMMGKTLCWSIQRSAKSNHDAKSTSQRNNNVALRIN